MSEQLPHLLIVEDEPITLRQLCSHFEKEGYTVTGRANADGVLEQISKENVNVCLIDINLPGKDGLTLTREVRAMSAVGIILVTGKNDQVDRIAGLESGADDYVTKPFDPRELLARVKNLIWRVQAQEKQKGKDSTLKFEGWTLDINKRELSTPGGKQQTLSAGEFRLLLALIEKTGEVMTRDQLMNRIRNREWYPDDRYIDVLVGQVRRKFRQHDHDTTFISTIHGTGYLFSPTVTE